LLLFLSSGQLNWRVRLLLNDISTKVYVQLFATLAAKPNIEVRLANSFALRKSRADMATDFKRLDHRMHNKSITFDNCPR
jgi:putative cardiolipin synthase